MCMCEHPRADYGMSLSEFLVLLYKSSVWSYESVP